MLAGVAEASNEAISCAARTEVRFYDAEILRVKGDLLAGMGDGDEARQCYEGALEVAATQGAESLRRRAEASLRAFPGPTPVASTP